MIGLAAPGAAATPSAAGNASAPARPTTQKLLISRAFQRPCPHLSTRRCAREVCEAVTSGAARRRLGESPWLAAGAQHASQGHPLAGGERGQDDVDLLAAKLGTAAFAGELHNRAAHDSAANFA